MRGLVTLLALSACAHPGPGRSADALPAMVSALASGSTFAAVAQYQATTLSDAERCRAYGASATLAGVAAETLASGWDTFQGGSVDLQGCYEFEVPGATVIDEEQILSEAIFVTLQPAMIVHSAYADSVPCRVRADTRAAIAFAASWTAQFRIESLDPEADWVLDIPSASIAEDDCRD